MPVAGRYGGQKEIGAVSSVLSTKRNKIITGQYDNAAVRTVVKVSSSVCKFCKTKKITRQQ